jgi:hypothetical protein
MGAKEKKAEQQGKDFVEKAPTKRYTATNQQKSPILG